MHGCTIKTKDPFASYQDTLSEEDLEVLVNVSHHGDLSGIARIHWKGRRKPHPQDTDYFRCEDLITCTGHPGCDWTSNGNYDDYECCPHCAQLGKIVKVETGKFFGISCAIPATLFKRVGREAIVNEFISVLEQIPLE